MTIFILLSNLLLVIEYINFIYSVKKKINQNQKNNGYNKKSLLIETMLFLILLLIINSSSTTHNKIHNKKNGNTPETKENLLNTIRYKYKLINNPRTQNTTVLCRFRSRELVLSFTHILHSGDNEDIPNDTAFLHAQNLDTQQLYNFKSPCKFDGNILDCFGWNWRTVTHKSKYKLWLTRTQNHLKNILWQSKDDFNLAEHMFGCTDHNLTRLKIKKTLHSSILLKWKGGITSEVFKPRYDVFVNGTIKKTNFKCKRSCHAKLYNIFPCDEYNICVRKKYTFTYLRNHIRPDEICITKPSNCTGDGDVLPTSPPSKERIKIESESIIIVSIFCGGLLIFIAVFVLVKLKVCQTSIDDEDKIEPRSTNIRQNYTTIESIAPVQYASIDDDQDEMVNPNNNTEKTHQRCFRPSVRFKNSAVDLPSLNGKHDFTRNLFISQVGDDENSIAHQNNQNNDPPEIPNTARPPRSQTLSQSSSINESIQSDIIEKNNQHGLVVNFLMKTFGLFNRQDSSEKELINANS